MKWTLRDPLHDLREVSDSFMVGRFYLRLEGSSLKVESEEEENDELVSAARILAEQYIAILQKYIPASIGRLMTDDEFASMPPWASMVVIDRKTPEKHALFRYGLRKARHEMLASSDPYLCRCYDYLEDAREDEINYPFHLYKLAETFKQAIEHEAPNNGGGLLKKLKVEHAYGNLRKICSEKQHDARHAPIVGEEVKPLSAEDRSHAMDWAYAILAAYERHIQSSLVMSECPNTLLRESS